tara:strand:- start:979 stop:1695 length:717 start_codon:yes stop_codon:yes gene_type:complete
MKKQLSNVAIIPARLGSKRIKNKNIKIFDSKPIIEWTLKIIKSSKVFEKVVLSSDDDGILRLGKRIGFDILIKRPKNLADDYTSTEEVTKHSIKKLEENFNIKKACCIYPCNPFLQIKDLKSASKLLRKSKNIYVFPVTNFSHPIERAYSYKKNGNLKYINKKFAKTRTQDLNVKFYDAGQFYFASKKTWLNLKKAQRVGLKIPNWRTIDIDNLDDWRRAELMFKFMKKNKKTLKKIL